jgi:hypothetical protein
MHEILGVDFLNSFTHINKNGFRAKNPKAISKFGAEGGT